MRRCTIIISAAFSIFFSILVFADAPNELMQINVVVPDQSSAAFQVALQTAFTEAMTQISNDPQITAKPIFQNAEKNIMQFVQSYQYVQQPNSMLQIVFDRTAMQKLCGQPASVMKNITTVSTQRASFLALTISGIQDIADYENTLQALRKKSGVEKVSAGEITDNQVEFVIKLADNVDANHFKQDLSSDAHFRASTQDQYLWIGNQA